MKNKGFSVPEGRGDGSLARSAWEQAPQAPSRRVRSDRVTPEPPSGSAHSLNQPQFDSHVLTPCPTGRTQPPRHSRHFVSRLPSSCPFNRFALGFFNPAAAGPSPDCSRTTRQTRSSVRLCPRLQTFSARGDAHPPRQELLDLVKLTPMRSRRTAAKCGGLSQTVSAESRFR